MFGYSHNTEIKFVKSTLHLSHVALAVSVVLDVSQRRSCFVSSVYYHEEVNQNVLNNSDKLSF